MCSFLTVVEAVEAGAGVGGFGFKVGVGGVDSHLHLPSQVQLKLVPRQVVHEKCCTTLLAVPQPVQVSISVGRCTVTVGARIGLVCTAAWKSRGVILQTR